MKPVILLADDEPQIRRSLKTSLVAHGYVVIEAKSGEEAVEKMRSESVDLVVLDMNMPGMGGLAACGEIRDGFDVPIIILTVRDAERDKVAALDSGADDYVVKPVGTPELLARIRSNLRRRQTEKGDLELAVATKELVIDFERRQVQVRGRVVRLTPKEFDLLRELVAQSGKPISHRELLQSVWGPDYGD